MCSTYIGPLRDGDNCHLNLKMSTEWTRLYFSDANSSWILVQIHRSFLHERIFVATFVWKLDECNVEY